VLSPDKGDEYQHRPIGLCVMTNNILKA